MRFLILTGTSVTGYNAALLVFSFTLGLPFNLHPSNSVSTCRQTSSCYRRHCCWTCATFSPRPIIHSISPTRRWITPKLCLRTDPDMLNLTNAPTHLLPSFYKTTFQPGLIMHRLTFLIARRDGSPRSLPVTQRRRYT